MTCTCCLELLHFVDTQRRRSMCLCKQHRCEEIVHWLDAGYSVCTCSSRIVLAAFIDRFCVANGLRLQSVQLQLYHSRRLAHYMHHKIVLSLNYLSGLMQQLCFLVFAAQFVGHPAQGRHLVTVHTALQEEQIPLDTAGRASR